MCLDSGVHCSSTTPATATLVTMTQSHVMPSIRRKPRLTYKSPSGADSRFSRPSLSKAISQHVFSSSPSSSLQVSGTKFEAIGTAMLTKRSKYSLRPPLPLPLYHPLGRLALSLPLLDPASVGLPVRSADSNRRISARARRPVAKLLRDGVDEDFALITAEPIVEVETREKSTSRKRKAANGSKRKRKEIDDGDAAYPAKRTRALSLRGATNQNRAGDADEESPTESSIQFHEATPTPEPGLEDKKSDRRSKRPKGSIKRRDSSTSEAPSSASVEGGGISTKEAESMEYDKVSNESPSRLDYDDGVEREEGEFSEQSTPNFQNVKPHLASQMS